jgi:hypothetical protein
MYRNASRTPRAGDTVITRNGNRATIIRFVTRPGQGLNEAFARVRTDDGREGTVNTLELIYVEANE